MAVHMVPAGRVLDLGPARAGDALAAELDPLVLRGRIYGHVREGIVRDNILNKPPWLQFLIVGLIEQHCAVFPYHPYVVFYCGNGAAHMLWRQTGPDLMQPIEFDRLLHELQPKRRDKVLELFQKTVDLMPKEDPYP
jgi:hypothetical protein